MRARNIGYWVSTVIVAFVLLSGGVADVAHWKDTVEGMTRLGYPVYFTTVLGVWKLLGGLALLAPRLPRLKEWAYAGAFFDFSGAAVSHASVGDPLGHLAFPAAFAVLTLVSWALRPPDRILGSLRLAPATTRAAAATLAACAAATAVWSASDPAKFLTQPLVKEIYTADPSAHVFGGQIYIYPVARHRGGDTPGRPGQPLRHARLPRAVHGRGRRAGHRARRRPRHQGRSLGGPADVGARTRRRREASTSCTSR